MQGPPSMVLFKYSIAYKSSIEFIYDSNIQTVGFLVVSLYHTPSSR